MMVFGLLAPCECEWLIAVRVSQPPGFARRLGFFGKESTVDFQINSLPRQFHRSARDARFRRGKGNAFVATGRRDRYVDVEREHRAPRAGEQCTKVAGSFPLWAGHKRHLLAIQPSLANQEPSRNGNAHPSIFQYVDREIRVSLSQFTADKQFVIDPRQSGIKRRRLRIVLYWIGLCA